MIDSILEEYKKRIIETNKEYRKIVNNKIMYIIYILLIILFIASNIWSYFSSISDLVKNIFSSISLFLLAISPIIIVSINDKHVKEKPNIHIMKLDVLKSLLIKKHLYSKNKMEALLIHINKIYPDKRIKLTNIIPTIIAVFTCLSNPAKSLYIYIRDNLKLSNYDMTLIIFFAIAFIYTIMVFIIFIYQTFLDKKPYIKQFKSDLEYLIISES